MSCSQCNNNFDETSIKSWFRQTPYNKKCPMCIVNWTEFNVYINGQEEESEILDPPTSS